MTDIDQQPKLEAPDPSGRRRPARVAVIALIAVLLLGEAGARILEPYLRNVPEWGSNDLDEKVADMEALNGAGADVVFMGSSAVNRGFDGDLFSELVGQTAFNAAIDGSSPRLIEVFIDEVVEPTLDPTVVIIGLTSRAFNDNALSQQELLDTYLTSSGRAAFLGTAPIKQRLEELAEKGSAFLRHRPALRSPRQLIDALRRIELTETPETTDRPYEVDETWANQMATRSLAGYEIGGLELEALARTVDKMSAAGVRVVLVDLPVVVEDWAALHPDGLANIEAFHEALAAFAAEHDVELVDTREETWPIDQFRDPVHLNTVGQERLTRLMAEHLTGSP